MFSLEGRTAVVTGGTRGIGAAIAIALAEAGADIILIQVLPPIPSFPILYTLAIHPQPYTQSFQNPTNTPSQRDESNKTTHNAILSLSRKCTIYTCDLTSQSSVTQLTPRIHADGHDPSILISSAGIQRRRPAHTFPQSDWDEVLQVNLTSVFTLTRDLGAYMLTRPGTPTSTPSSTSSSPPHRGNIITIASLTTFQGGINIPAYAATKGAVGQLTKALSNEWASHGINVNAVAPGWVATELTQVLTSDPVASKTILDRIPAGRWAGPEDFKGVAVFLAGRGSAYVSGEVLTVDGGWMGR